MKIRTFALVCACTPIFASAQVTPIGPFTGSMQEGWETHALGQFLPMLDIFGGAGDAVQISAGQGPARHNGLGIHPYDFPTQWWQVYGRRRRQLRAGV